MPSMGLLVRRDTRKTALDTDLDGPSHFVVKKTSDSKLEEGSEPGHALVHV